MTKRLREEEEPAGYFFNFARVTSGIFKTMQDFLFSPAKPTDQPLDGSAVTNENASENHEPSLAPHQEVSMPVPQPEPRAELAAERAQYARMKSELAARPKVGWQVDANKPFIHQLREVEGRQQEADYLSFRLGCLSVFDCHNPSPSFQTPSSIGHYDRSPDFSTASPYHAPYSSQSYNNTNGQLSHGPTISSSINHYAQTPYKPPQDEMRQQNLKKAKTEPNNTNAINIASPKTTAPTTSVTSKSAQAKPSKPASGIVASKPNEITILDSSEEDEGSEGEQAVESMEEVPHSPQEVLRAFSVKHREKQELLNKSLKRRTQLDEARKVPGKRLAPQYETQCKALFQPPTNKGKIYVRIANIDIKYPDLATLLPRQWLNDEIVNSFMEILNVENKKPENVDYPKCYFKLSFFYPTLTQYGRGYNYDKVKKWTKYDNIFEFDFVIIPFHVNENHWCLAIVNFRDKRLEYYDSMGNRNPQCIANIKRYLQDESLDKRNIPIENFDDWTLYEPRGSIPQQSNIYDCGVFMCQFAETLSSGNDIQNISQADMPYYRKRMALEIVNFNKHFDSPL